MKIARFTSGGSDPQFGIIDDGELVVLLGDPMFSGFQTTEERVPIAEAKLLAPVIPRSKVVCIAANYPDAPDAVPGDRPVFTIKPNTTVIGPGDPIRIPPVHGRVAHEGELAVVIGAVAKRVRAEDADDVIFGYTIATDVTAIDELLADGQADRAKGYDTFCPVGPVIETEIDPRGADITTTVDREVRRTGNTREMIFGIPDLVEYVSNVFTLLPGDLILTGSPAGLGGFVAGQTVEVQIGGIGRLVNPARARD